MKKRILLVGLAVSSCLFSFGQEKFTRFHFSGYEVVIVPSETFSMDVKNPKLGTQKADGNSFRLEIIDQKGRMPKDTVIIHTNKIDFLYLHNSVLVMDDCLVTDSLKLSALSSSGSVNVKSDYLKINLAAGSGIKASGEAKCFVGNIRAASHLNAKSLVVDNAEIEAVAHSTVTVNAKKIIRLDNRDSSVENVQLK